ncbi:MAG TPA: very short patch repair endonuclease [Verrucomicrobiae bacterium]
MSNIRRQRNFQGRDFRKKRQPDPLNRRKRSRLMSRIRAYGSKMEISFVAMLKSSCDEMFEINDRTLIGKPDIVFRRVKVCVFLDSDFWHGWQYPRWRHLLKSEFWRRKIQRNRERDKEVTRRLRRQGWTVIRLWEHNLAGDAGNALTLITSSILVDDAARNSKSGLFL